MSSALAKYRSTQEAIAQLRAELQLMESDDALKRELEFESKVKALLEEYAFTPAKALAVIYPERTQAVTEGKQAKVRRPRKLSVYVNPHTNEVVETKGGNNNILKGWSEQYGKDVVKGWKTA